VALIAGERRIDERFDEQHGFIDAVLTGSDSAYIGVIVLFG